MLIVECRFDFICINEITPVSLVVAHICRVHTGNCTYYVAILNASGSKWKLTSTTMMVTTTTLKNCFAILFRMPVKATTFVTVLT